MGKTSAHGSINSAVVEICYASFFFLIVVVVIGAFYVDLLYSFKKSRLLF